MKLLFGIVALFLAVQVNAGQIELKVNRGTTVEGQSQYSYNFGTVWVNSRAVANYTLRNTGTTPLAFNRAYIYGADFSANHSCDRVIMPNEVCNFSIYYWPMFEGLSSGRFVLSFIEDDIVVDLWGQARR